MVKNVTVQVGDELAAEMEKLPDVNWSQVVRSCLQRYCNIRLNPDIEALLQKMKQQKDEAYSEGYKAALAWFKQEAVRYQDVNGIFQALDGLRVDFDIGIEETYGSYEDAVKEGVDTISLWNTEKSRFWIKTIEEIIENLLDIYEISTAFVEGFKAALKKLERVE